MGRFLSFLPRFLGKKNGVRSESALTAQNGYARPRRLGMEPLEERTLLAVSALRVGSNAYDVTSDYYGEGWVWIKAEQKLSLDNFVGGAIEISFNDTQVGSLDAHTMTFDLGTDGDKHVINAGVDSEGLYLSNGKMILIGSNALSVYGGLYVAGDGTDTTANIDDSNFTGTVYYGEHEITEFVNSYAELYTALDNLASAGSATYMITNDLFRDSTDSQLVITNKKNITLLSSGDWTMTSHVDLKTSLIVVNSSEVLSNTDVSVVDNDTTFNLGVASRLGSATLTIDGSYKTLVNGKMTVTREATGALIHNAGTFNMYEGFTLTNNYNGTTSTSLPADLGGGVYVAGPDPNCSSTARMLTVDEYGNLVTKGGADASATRARFNMYGGTITSCIGGRGGGVQVFGVFTMEGGTITGNSVNTTSTFLEGGGVFSRGYVFIKGGEITYNLNLRNTKSEFGKGGALHNSNGGYMEISGGTISHNQAIRGGGIYAGGNGFSTLIIKGGEISYNYATGEYTSGVFYGDGGGIWTNSSVELYGGTIVYNTTKSNVGNGMYIKTADTTGNYTDPVIIIGGEGSISTTNQVYIGTLYRNKNTSSQNPLVPIRVVSKLTSIGSVMFVSGVVTDVYEGLPLIHFADGLTVQINKFTLDDSTYELTQGIGEFTGGGTLPSGITYTQTMVFTRIDDEGFFHARIGDMFFLTTDEMIEWVSTCYKEQSWRYDTVSNRQSVRLEEIDRTVFIDASSNVTFASLDGYGTYDETDTVFYDNAGTQLGTITGEVVHRQTVLLDGTYYSTVIDTLGAIKIAALDGTGTYDGTNTVFYTMAGTQLGTVTGTVTDGQKVTFSSTDYIVLIDTDGAIKIVAIDGTGVAGTGWAVGKTLFYDLSAVPVELYNRCASNAVIALYDAGCGRTQNNPLKLYQFHNSIFTHGCTVAGHVQLLSETDATKLACTNLYGDNYTDYFKVLFSGSGSERTVKCTAMTQDYVWSSDGDYAIAVHDTTMVPQGKTAIVTVEEGASFVLGDGLGYLTFNGNYQYALNGSFFYVLGDMTINTNATIKNARNAYSQITQTTQLGGGIVVDGSGTLTVLGLIKDCAGMMSGAISVVSETASVSIYGGDLINNTGGLSSLYGTVSDENLTGSGAIMNVSGEITNAGRTWFYLDSDPDVPIYSLSNAVPSQFQVGGVTYTVTVDGTTGAITFTDGTVTGIGKRTAGGDVTAPWTHANLYQQSLNCPCVSWFYRTDGTLIGSRLGTVTNGETFTLYDYSQSALITYTVLVSGDDILLQVSDVTVGMVYYDNVEYVEWGNGCTVTIDAATWFYRADTDANLTSAMGYVVGKVTSGQTVTLGGVAYTVTVDATTGAITIVNPNDSTDTGVGQYDESVITDNDGVFGGIYNNGTVKLIEGTVTDNNNKYDLLEITADTFCFSGKSNMTVTNDADTGKALMIRNDGSPTFYDEQGNTYRPTWTCNDPWRASDIGITALSGSFIYNGTTYAFTATDLVLTYTCRGATSVYLTGVSGIPSIDVGDYALTYADITLPFKISLSKLTADSRGYATDISSDHVWVNGSATTTGTVTVKTIGSMTGGADTRQYVTFTAYATTGTVFNEFGDNYSITRTGTLVSDGVAGTVTDGTNTYTFQNADLYYSYNATTGLASVQLIVLAADTTIPSNFTFDENFYLVVAKTEIIRGNIGIWQAGTLEISTGAVIDGSNLIYLDHGAVITVTEPLDLDAYAENGLTIDSCSLEPTTKLLVVDYPETTVGEVDEATRIVKSELFNHIRTKYVVQNEDTSANLINEIVIDYAKVTYYRNWSGLDTTCYVDPANYYGGETVSTLRLADTGLEPPSADYYFVGWCTAADGNGDWYFPDNVSRSGIKVSAITTKLYAQWTQNILSTLDDEITPNDGYRSLREAVIISQYSSLASDSYIVLSNDYTNWEQYTGNVSANKDNKSGLEWTYAFASEMSVLLDMTRSAAARLSSATAAEINAVMSAYYTELNTRYVSDPDWTALVWTDVDDPMTCIFKSLTIDAYPIISTSISGTGKQVNQCTIFTKSNGYVLGYIERAAVDGETLTFGSSNYTVHINGTTGAIELLDAQSVLVATGEYKNEVTTLFFYADDTNQTQPFASVAGEITDGDSVTLGRAKCAVTVSEGAITFASTNTVLRSVTVDAQDNSRHFSVGIANGAGLDATTEQTAAYVEANPVMFAGLTFSNGRAVNGGSFFVQSGNVTFTSCNFYDNAATNNGGSIVNTGGSLTLNSYDNRTTLDMAELYTTFINKADTSLVNARNGGAIYNCGDLTMDGTKMIYLNVSNNGGAIHNNFIGSETNGISALANCTVTFSFITDNTALNYGGAIANYGVLSVSDESRIEDNFAGKNGGGICNGYSVTTGGDQSSLYLGYISISRNRADGTGNGTPGSSSFDMTKGGYGGGVLNASLLEIKGTLFIGNTAKINGGAISNTAYAVVFTDESEATLGEAHIYDSPDGTFTIIKDNTATAYGGGIGSWGILTINGHTSIVFNTANYGSNIFVYEGAQYEYTSMYSLDGIMYLSDLNATVEQGASLKIAQYESLQNVSLLVDREGEGNYVDLGDLHAVTTNELGLAIGETTLTYKLRSADGIETLAAVMTLNVTAASEKSVVWDVSAESYERYVLDAGRNENDDYFWATLTGVGADGSSTVVRSSVLLAAASRVEVLGAASRPEDFVALDGAMSSLGEIVFLGGGNNALRYGSVSVCGGESAEYQIDSGTAYFGKKILGTGQIVKRGGAVLIFAGVQSAQIVTESNDCRFTLLGISSALTLSVGGQNNTLDLAEASAKGVCVDLGSNKAQRIIAGEIGTLTLDGRFDAYVGSLGADTVTTAGSVDTVIVDESANNTIELADAANQVVLVGENQTVVAIASGSNDIRLAAADRSTVDLSVCGVETEQRVSADGANLTIIGGAGNDFIEVFGSAARIEGGAGDDQIVLSNDDTSEANESVVDGGTGNDLIWAANSNGRNFLYGQDGCDAIFGGLGQDHIEGGDGRNILFCSDGADELYGGAQSDLLVAGRTEKFLDMETWNTARAIEETVNLYETWVNSDDRQRALDETLALLGASLGDGQSDSLYRGGGSRNLFCESSADNDSDDAQELSPELDQILNAK